ncbi:hypothetical protein KCP75_01855 [Salmonella enterica subsp. enterica]|nr:hypothetical protein KCP75_01855 [Salmonella enterica subsp. enterica]
MTQFGARLYKRLFGGESQHARREAACPGEFGAFTLSTMDGAILSPCTTHDFSYQCRYAKSDMICQRC